MLNLFVFDFDNTCLLLLPDQIVNYLTCCLKKKTCCDIYIWTHNAPFTNFCCGETVSLWTLQWKKLLKHPYTSTRFPLQLVTAVGLIGLIKRSGFKHSNKLCSEEWKTSRNHRKPSRQSSEVGLALDPPPPPLSGVSWYPFHRV